jgi:hypothetical protein
MRVDLRSQPAFIQGRRDGGATPESEAARSLAHCAIPLGSVADS